MEKRYGKATLLTPGDIAIMVQALSERYPACTDLIDKLVELGDD